MALPNNAIQLLLGGLTDPKSTAQLLAQLAPGPEAFQSPTGAGGTGSPNVGDFVNPTAAGAPGSDPFAIVRAIQEQSGASGDPALGPTPQQPAFTIPPDIFAGQQQSGSANQLDLAGSIFGGGEGEGAFTAANAAAALGGLSKLLGSSGGEAKPLRIPNAPPPPQGRGAGTSSQTTGVLQNAVAPAARAVNGQIPSLAELILGRRF